MSFPIDYNFLSISTLSSCSQVKFDPVLPKCPNADVGWYLILSKLSDFIIPLGVRSKTSFIILDIFSSFTLPVPNVFTETDVGFSTPIAYEI